MPWTDSACAAGPISRDLVFVSSLLDGLVVWYGRLPKENAANVGWSYGVHSRELAFLVFLFAFRVSFSARLDAGVAAFGVPLAGGAEGASQVAFSALAPHGAGDCLPRNDPQSIAFFPIGRARFGCVLGGGLAEAVSLWGIQRPVELHFGVTIQDPEDL